ncbi:MAG: LysR family transcriptional regulator [Clostridium sp.]
MTLRHMRIFLEVCEQNSITKAADKLFLAQPAVSFAIKELENYYGVILFDRISRKLYITEHGMQLLDYARSIIHLFDEMELYLKNNANNGKIMVGSSITISTCYMAKFVKQFMLENPEIKVCVSVDSSNTLEEKVLKNELDIALIEGISCQENIISENFFSSQLSFVCNTNHPFAYQNNIDLSQLSKEPLLLREKGSGTRQLVDSVFLTNGIRSEPTWESTSTTALVSAVIENLGISVLPFELVRNLIASQRLAYFTVEGMVFERNFSFIMHKNKILTQQILKFIEICKNKINE